MIALACIALSCCLICCWPTRSGRRLTELLKGGQKNRQSHRSNRWLIVVAAGITVTISAVLMPSLLVWLIPGSVVGCTAYWLIANGRAERTRHHNSEEVVQICLAVATQLRVGDISAAALSTVAADAPLLQPVAATQAIGGDVPAALRTAAEQPGCQGLAALARSWQLCQVTGAPIADAATRVADGLRAEAAAERLVASELASPRATGRMLAFLPVLGIGLGFTTGGDPLTFLLGGLIGRICLGAAICLVCAGLVWTTQLGKLLGSKAEAS